MQGALSKHMLIDVLFTDCAAASSAASAMLEVNADGLTTRAQFEDLFSQWKAMHPGASTHLSALQLCRGCM